MDQVPEHPPQLSQHQEIGGYRIVRFIGRGGMAEVYEARDLTLDRRVAVKVPRANVQGKHGKERFLNEARKAALINHQNVVTIHTAGEQDGLLYLVMQYVDGQDLAEILRGGALPWDRALLIIRHASRGLHAVHRQGLVHRDIKPSNIMLSVDSEVFVMDFGLVRDDASELTSIGELLGTPPFMSPEQCRGERLDQQSDVYSLGATLYCLISGRRPFDGAVLHVLQSIGRGARPEPIQHVVSGLPDTVAAFIDKAMAPQRANRFSDAQEMSRAAFRILGEGKKRPPPPPFDPSRRGGGRVIARRPTGSSDSVFWIALAAILTTVLVLAIAAALLLPKYLQSRADVPSEENSRVVGVEPRGRLASPQKTASPSLGARVSRDSPLDPRCPVQPPYANLPTARSLDRL